MREVFTTGQAARVLRVCPRTVLNLMNRGDLKGWRIPGSQHRRVPRESLAALVERLGMDPARLEMFDTHKEESHG